MKKCSVEDCDRLCWSPNPKCKYCKEHRDIIRKKQQARYHALLKEPGEGFVAPRRKRDAAISRSDFIHNPNTEKWLTRILKHETIIV